MFFRYLLAVFLTLKSLYMYHFDLLISIWYWFLTNIYVTGFIMCLCKHLSVLNSNCTIHIFVSSVLNCDIFKFWFCYRIHSHSTWYPFTISKTQLFGRMLLLVCLWGNLCYYSTGATVELTYLHGNLFAIIIEPLVMFNKLLLDFCSFCNWLV